VPAGRSQPFALKGQQACFDLFPDEAGTVWHIRVIGNRTEKLSLATSLDNLGSMFEESMVSLAHLIDLLSIVFGATRGYGLIRRRI
jgi:hypothetical protein